MNVKRKYLPLAWLLLSFAVLVVDYWSGPSIQFPIIFVVPVIYASWYSGRAWGIALAVLLSVVRLVLDRVWNVSVLTHDSEINFAIRLIVFVGTAVLVAHTARLTQEIKVLRGFLPICSSCKKVRTEQGEWKPLEEYISEHTTTELSHGLCAECATRLYPQYYGQKDDRAERQE
jgi:hypothetical protein